MLKVGGREVPVVAFEVDLPDGGTLRRLGIDNLGLSARDDPQGRLITHFIVLY